MTDPIKAKRDAQRLFWDTWWRNAELRAAERLTREMTPMDWAERFQYDPPYQKPGRRMDA